MYILRRIVHGPLARYVKLRVVPAPGMSGTFSTPPRVSDPDIHHGTCVTHVPRCMSKSPTSAFLWSRRWENVPSIPGGCTTRNFSCLVRGPCLWLYSAFDTRRNLWRPCLVIVIISQWVLCDDFAEISQVNTWCDVLIASLLRQNNDAASFWRNNGIMITLYVCWNRSSIRETFATCSSSGVNSTCSNRGTACGAWNGLCRTPYEIYIWNKISTTSPRDTRSSSMSNMRQHIAFATASSWYW